MAGTWNPLSLPKRPGLYINFVDAAIEAIRGGPRGIVAMPILEFDEEEGEAEKGEFYTIQRQSRAEDLFGEDYITPINLALNAGAREVLAYAVPDAEEAKKATMTTDLEGDNNDIKYTAKNEGIDGNDKSVEYVDPEENSSELTISVIDKKITINLGTDDEGNINSTAEDVKLAVNEDVDASAIVEADHVEDSDGTGKVTAMEETYLAGGQESDGKISLNQMLTDFESEFFNVFNYPGLTDNNNQLEIKNWAEFNREYGKHFFVVFGGSEEDDKDPEVGNERSVALRDEYGYIVNLITGGEVFEEEYSSAEYAPYIAGLIAGTRINESITYKQVSLTRPNKKLRHTQIVDALEAGSLVLVYDGEKVKVESGITTTGDKIRPISARHAVAMDISATASDNYIGRLDNNPDGQAALKSAITAYLERLENNNVLIDPVVYLDPDRPSEGDKVFIIIEYTEVDSMERIFLDVKV